MHFSKNKSISKMNEWGKANIPFLFIIDFEMLQIQLFRLDEPMPENIKFSFPRFNQHITSKNSSSNFIFFKNSVSFELYNEKFNAAIKEINAGNSFLLNLTFPTKIETNLSLSEFYNYATSKYKLLVNKEFVVFSPETFIQINEGTISSNPMKGTIQANIENAAKTILTDEKETAEHNTIVDLIRNDLSKVATQVNVKRFRYIDEIETNDGKLLQVSSEIEGKLPDNFHNNIGNIIFELLPAGSVTGAPKVKTVKIIKEIETVKRGYYTGVFGYFRNKQLDSAVMIRYIETIDNNFYFRSGGGITNLSIAENEYKELIDKVYAPFA
jgi:para-aminobenzoate synthetase component 1